MKNIIIIWMLLFIISCKQDEEVKKVILPLGPVFAAQVSNEMTYYDFVPDIDLDTLSGIPMTTQNVNEFNLDIDENGEKDISLFVKRENQFANCEVAVKPLKNTSISISSLGCVRRMSGCNCKECWGDVPLFTNGAKINNDTSSWTPVGLRDKEGDTLINEYSSLQYIYSYDTTAWQNKPNRYLGFRFVENNDTLYGWMRVSIIGKAHIVIHDCAYQKR